jgi:hypothetical protein
MQKLLFFLSMLSLGLAGQPVLAQKPKKAPNMGGGAAPQAGQRKQGMFDNALRPTASGGPTRTGDTLVVDSVAVGAVGSLKLVKQEAFMGVTNDTGKIILPIDYDEVSFFNKKDSACSRWEGMLRIRMGKMYGLFSPAGKPVTTLDYEELSFFPETCGSSHAASYVVKAKQGGKYGLVSGKGEVIIRPAYDDIFLLKNEKERVTTPEVVVVRKAGKHGMMELRDKQILKTEYDQIEYLQTLEVKEKNKTEKHLLLKIRQGDRWGLINLSTKQQFDLEFQYIEPFSEGLAIVKKGDKFGFIDQDSKLKVACNYDAAQPFANGVAVVAKNGKHGLINPDKKEVVKLAYESLAHLVPDEKKRRADAYFAALFLAKKDGKVGVLHQNGKVIVPFEYEALEFLPKKFGFNATKDGKSQFVELPAQAQ